MSTYDNQVWNIPNVPIRMKQAKQGIQIKGFPILKQVPEQGNRLMCTIILVTKHAPNSKSRQSFTGKVQSHPAPKKVLKTALIWAQDSQFPVATDKEEGGKPGSGQSSEANWRVVLVSWTSKFLLTYWGAIKVCYPSLLITYIKYIIEYNCY